MSRKERLEAARARRAAGIEPLPATEELPPNHDPRLGPPPPVIAKAPEPIPIPRHLKGPYSVCCGCGSYIAGALCTRCT